MSKFYNNKKLVLFILALVVMLGAFSVYKIITLNTPNEATIYNEAKIYGPSTGTETITGDAEIEADGIDRCSAIAGSLTDLNLCPPSSRYTPTHLLIRAAAGRPHQRHACFMALLQIL